MRLLLSGAASQGTATAPGQELKVTLLDAKNLLDVLDSIRLNFPLVDRYAAPAPCRPPPLPPGW